MPTSLCDHDTSLIARTALGELTDDERATLATRLAACPACRSRLDDYRALLGGVAHLFDGPQQLRTPAPERRHPMSAPAQDELHQPPASARAQPRPARRPSALAAGLVAALLIVALAGVYAFIGPGRGLRRGQQGTSQTCASAPTPKPVLAINNAIGASPFWVGGFFGGFPGHHAALDVQGAMATPHGSMGKVVTQFAPGTTQPVMLSGKRLSDGAPLWFQFDAGFGPAVPAATAFTFDPARSLNDSGYILIPATGCYALTARWSTGSWTLTFQGIV